MGDVLIENRRTIVLPSARVEHPLPIRLKQMHDRIKVLHVYRTYFPDTQGGLEEVIRQICQNTMSLGIESRVFCLSREKNPQPVERPEAVVHRSKQDFEIASCGVSHRAFREFRKLLDWADVVQYHFPWPFADLMHLTTPVHQETVVTYHSDIVRQRKLGWIYRPMMNRFLNDIDVVVCTSPNYYATSDVLQNIRSRVEIIPIGLNENTYPDVTDHELEEVRSSYGEGFFLFVGVLRYYKGLHILLDAIKNTSHKVVIAGAGPTERELLVQARELGLTNVKFTGYVPDRVKVGLIKLSKAIVFPSYLRAEAFGVTLLEGAMHGKPMISTEIGSGTSHVNIDGLTGLVVTPGSVEELRHAMDQLSGRPEVAQLMGRRARERFLKLFTGQLMGRRYADIYHELKPRMTQPTEGQVSIRVEGI